MPKAPTADPRLPAEYRLTSAAVPWPEGHPEALLRWGQGRARGFWARRGRWFAHVGEVASLSLPSHSGEETRFQAVWKEAREVFSCSWKDPQSELNPPSPRLFGGFAFEPGHDANGVWEGFPTAHFVLPEVELMGGMEGGVLTARKRMPAEEAPKRFREELRRLVASVEEGLKATPAARGDAGVAIPATRAEMDQAAWTKAVERALGGIAAGVFSKVVLARAQTVTLDGEVDPVDVVMNLWRDNPGSHVFLYEPLPGHALVGAAPETLATVNGGRFHATTVAGSIAAGRDEAEQKTLARSLLRSPKDRREHEMCVADTVERLRGLATSVSAENAPHVLTLAAIQHLETVVEAELHPEATVLSVVEALHPTPAVCGLPRDRALEFLHEEEAFQRGWYAGPVGWFDADGNGVFVPALRSAVGRGEEWRVFAGAGIVAGSEPAREWEETRIKFQPMLKALASAPVKRDSGPAEASEVA